MILTVLLLVLYEFVKLPSFMMLNVVVYQMPYFLIGVLLASHLGQLREIKPLHVVVVSLCCIGLYLITDTKMQIWGADYNDQAFARIPNDYPFLLRNFGGYKIGQIIKSVGYNMPFLRGL